MERQTINELKMGTGSFQQTFIFHIDQHSKKRKKRKKLDDSVKVTTVSVSHNCSIQFTESELMKEAHRLIKVLALWEFGLRIWNT